MRRVFIADAHLVRPEDDNYRLLLDFLSRLEGNTASLFILGDLFEFWIGYDQSRFPHYLPVLKQLEKLRKSGTDIIYFEGNHDFHLGAYFTGTLGATVYPAASTLMIDGMRVHLCHGDLVNTSDYGYRALRLALHSRLTRMLFPLFPPRLVFSVAGLLSRNSKRQHATRNHRWDYRTLLESFADSHFKAGCDAVVTAHFHLPFLSMHRSGPAKTLLALGDWVTQFSYGELSDGEFSLHRFQP